jgi:hypothetical protein
MKQIQYKKMENYQKIRYSTTMAYMQGDRYCISPIKCKPDLVPGNRRYEYYSRYSDNMRIYLQMNINKMADLQN